MWLSKGNMRFRNSSVGVLILIFILMKPDLCKGTKTAVIRPGDHTRTFLTELVGIHTFKLIALLAIPLFFLIFPLILLGGISLLFIPIPILSNPVTGLAGAIIGRRHNSQDELEQLLREISDSKECIERISCQVGRSISSLEIRGIADQTLNQLAPYLKDKWKSTIHGYVTGSNGRNVVKNNCVKYTCLLGNAVSPENWSI